jgi:hypothetical protein
MAAETRVLLCLWPSCNGAELRGSRTMPSRRIQHARRKITAPLQVIASRNWTSPAHSKLAMLAVRASLWTGDFLSGVQLAVGVDFIPALAVEQTK